MHDELHVITWSPLVGAGDVGAGLQMGGWADRTIQLSGTWAAGTVILEGSNDSTDGADGVWLPLTDPQGVAISKTADGIEAISELPRWVRPRVTVAVTSVNAIMTARRTR
jgi:hypothetical protein